MKASAKAKAIRLAVASSGYPAPFVYNDERAGGRRRMKFMDNGFIHSKAKYRKWESKIITELSVAGVKLERAGFEDLERPGYGSYKAFVAVFGDD